MFLVLQRWRLSAATWPDAFAAGILENVWWKSARIGRDILQRFMSRGQFVWKKKKSSQTSEQTQLTGDKNHSKSLHRGNLVIEWLFCLWWSVSFLYTNREENNKVRLWFVQLRYRKTSTSSQPHIQIWNVSPLVGFKGNEAQKTTSPCLFLNVYSIHWKWPASNS